MKRIGGLKMKIEDLIEEAGKLKDSIEADNKRLEMLRNNIKNIYSSAISVGEKPNLMSDNYNCQIAKRIDINYDYDKLKKKLDKDVFKTLVTKEYSLQDVPEFLKELKKYGVPVEVVKKHIISYSKIDNDKVQEAFDNDLFTLSDISGCYESTLKRVVRIIKK